MTERPWAACPLCGEPAQRSEYGLLCTNMECPSNGGQSSTAIDWKRRFKDQVAGNIGCDHADHYSNDGHEACEEIPEVGKR